MRLAIISVCGLVVTLWMSVLTATEKPKEPTTSIVFVEKSLATPVIPEPTPTPLSDEVASDTGTLVPQKEPQTETVPCPDCCQSHGAGSLCGGRPCRGERIQRFKAWMQASHWGYPEYFVARPLGSLLQAHMRTQACNALADQMVLYRYDFFDGVLEDASKLNPQGCKQLDRLIVMFQCGMHPLVIERAADDSQLDAARRSQVLKLLKEAEFPVPPEWVVVGDPEIARLSGEEAVEIHRNLLQQTRSGGGAVGGTTGGGAGFFVQPTTTDQGSQR